MAWGLACLSASLGTRPLRPKASCSLWSLRFLRKPLYLRWDLDSHHPHPRPHHPLPRRVQTECLRRALVLPKRLPTSHALHHSLRRLRLRAKARARRRAQRRRPVALSQQRLLKGLTRRRPNPATTALTPHASLRREQGLLQPNLFQLPCRLATSELPPLVGRHLPGAHTAAPEVLRVDERRMTSNAISPLMASPLRTRRVTEISRNLALNPRMNSQRMRAPCLDSLSTTSQGVYLVATLCSHSEVSLWSTTLCFPA
mmetsp:Transcript_27118/g.82185  ORF Transcript_27118/g.82185 Transcript_27118/m.82185 type:complete len:257 (+) Transcript_27118:894-1664(+)